MFVVYLFTETNGQSSSQNNFSEYLKFSSFANSESYADEATLVLSLVFIYNRSKVCDSVLLVPNKSYLILPAHSPASAVWF